MQCAADTYIYLLHVLHTFQVMTDHMFHCPKGYRKAKKFLSSSNVKGLNIVAQCITHALSTYHTASGIKVYHIQIPMAPNT